MRGFEPGIRVIFPCAGLPICSVEIVLTPVYFPLGVGELPLTRLNEINVHGCYWRVESIWFRQNWDVCYFYWLQNIDVGTSLVVQWLRIRLPMQGTRVWTLVRADPTYRGASKPVHHNYWACALEPVSHNYWAHVPQLLKPVCLEPMLRNKRSHHNEKPVHPNEE